MRTCDVQASGAVELYFYGELEGGERDDVARHLAGCDACARALEELAIIRDALNARPDVSAPAGGDWGPFMARLEQAVAREQLRRAVSPPAVSAPRRVSRRPAYAGYLAMAALLALVTMSVLFVARSRPAETTEPAPAVASGPEVAEPRLFGPDQGLSSVSEQHFEKSKLVLLGLAAKEGGEPGAWDYERDLAAGLLDDTRLYRMAAENRGMSRLAGVLRDLEIVLLQASMTDERDAAALERIQRFIRKRDVLGQMEAVSAATTGG